MVRWSLFVLCISVSLSYFPSANAAVRVDDLYEVEVPVQGQGVDERYSAMRSGFQELLSRLSGNQVLAHAPNLDKILARAPSLVQQYQYKQLVTDSEQASRFNPEVVLWIRYDDKAVRKWLEDNELPIWGSTRPQTLLWLVIQQGRERELLGGDQDSPLSKAMQKQAHRRGIPLLLPIMDLEDRRNIRVSDIWGGFTDPVMRASRRYAPENVLIARIYEHSPGQWESSWTLVQGADVQRWTYQGTDMDQAMAAGMDGAGDILAARYAFHSNTQNQAVVRLSISNVDSLQAYAEIDHYLSNLPLVAAYHAIRVEAGRVLYSLQVRGDLASLEQALSLENKLQVTEPPPVNPQPMQPLQVNTAEIDPITGMPAPVVDAMPESGQPAQVNVTETAPGIATTAPVVENSPETGQTVQQNPVETGTTPGTSVPVVDAMPESGQPAQTNISATDPGTGTSAPQVESTPSMDVQTLYYRLMM